LNCLFTGFILFAAIDNNQGKFPIFGILGYNILLFIPSWINNFWLLPQLAKNKKLKSYFLAVLSVILLSILVLGRYFHWLRLELRTNELSNFTPIAVTSSAPESMKGLQDYFDVFPGIVLVMSAMLIGYGFQNFLQNKKREENIRTEQINAELSLLKSQISPHFLFNVLNTLYSLSLKMSKETPDVILKLSDILRYSLYETKEKEISIPDEIHILKTYIDIECLRIGEKGNIHFTSHIIDNSVKIAPMLLLPFLENAFKYGTYSTVGQSFITASVHCDNNLIFTCQNSFKETSEKDFGGIGIENIRKRLQLLYPNNHTLEIEQSKDLFKVKLEIKLK